MLDEHPGQDASQVAHDIDDIHSSWEIPPFSGVLDGRSYVQCAWLSVDGQGVLRLGEDDQSPVAMATSCLVKAVCGDRVRAVLDAGTWYVTDILRRTNESSPLSIDVGDKTLNLLANRLCLDAQELYVTAQTWSTTATHVRQQLGSEVTQVEQRYVHAGSSATDVDTTAVTRAAHIVSHASQALVLRGKAASLGADGLLRIDGAQVHMG